MGKHKISNQMIRKELRFSGKIIRTIMPFFETGTLEKCNKVMDKYAKGKWLGRQTVMKEHWIKRADKSQLRLCICIPKKRKKSVPGLLWIHGGGYAIGLPEQDFRYMEKFAVNFGCICVSPDYRRSIESPYPAALDDCYLALVWLKEHAADYDINPSQIFIGGDSAGGGLAAAVSLYARDKGEVAIAYQMLLYPMIDDRMNTASSMNNDAPVWNSKSNEASWKLYLGDRYGTSDVPVYAAPAREQNYKNLPPTCAFVGTIEPFYDEPVTYMKNLRKAGVKLCFREYKGCFHAFDQICPRSKVAKSADRFLMRAFQYAVEHFFAAQP